MGEPISYETLVERVLLLEDALLPFANFADKSGTCPEGMPITRGSPMAQRQLTMEDCYRAADLLKRLKG